VGGAAVVAAAAAGVATKEPSEPWTMGRVIGGATD